MGGGAKQKIENFVRKIAVACSVKSSSSLLLVTSSLLVVLLLDQNFFLIGTANLNVISLKEIFCVEFPPAFIH